MDQLESEDNKKSAEHLIDTFERIVRCTDLSCMEHQIILFYLTGRRDLEIGKQFGYTPQRIGQIRLKAIEKLRNAFESNQEKEF
jgi:DNA-directed RNA polymerase sigma subunit (sigma70/sigma32)